MPDHPHSSGMNLGYSPFASRVNSRDRLVTALFFVTLLHGIVILGVTFSPDTHKPGNNPAVDVTLVKMASKNAPRHADYLAQTNSIGSGTTHRHVHPNSPLTTPAPLSSAGVTNATDTSNAAADRKHTSQTSGRRRTGAVKAKAMLSTTSTTNTSARIAPTPSPGGSAPRLLVARFMAQGREAIFPTEPHIKLPQATALNPRDRFIAVNARGTPYAAYIEAWRRKVQRVGNLNYPDDIRRRRLSGSLTLEVALNTDGSIREMIVRKPSVHPELNLAAKRIVRLASPFAPFPARIRKHADILRFVYVWHFENGHIGKGHARLSLPTR